MLTQPDADRIETTQHTWTFDRLRHRFSRVPKDRHPDDPMVVPSWEPYYALSFDPDGNAFTLTLDALGTRLLRVGIE